MRHPLKFDALEKLNAIKVPVASVIDVGVLTGTAELVDAYNECAHVLIEPIVEWNPIISSWYEKRKVNFKLVNVAASNFDGEMNMETSSVSEDCPITHARLTDKPGGANVRQVPVRRIDTLIPELNLPKPYLLKIDVDGVELQILEGAEGILADCSVVIVEAHPQDMRERMLAVLDAGFEIFDIVDPCYYDGRLAQVDLVFVNPAIGGDHDLAMYPGGFDLSKWDTYKRPDDNDAAGQHSSTRDNGGYKMKASPPVTKAPGLLAKLTSVFFARK